MTFSWMYLLAAVGGGMFGAAIGAIPAFVLAGVAAVGTYGLAAVSGAHPEWNLVPLSGLGPFGPWLSPNIAFAGGVAAAAYAARRGLHATGKDTVFALTGLNRPDVLAIGGVFGAYGYVVQWLCTDFSPSYNGVIVLTPVVTAIVVSNCTSRLIFGRTGLFGRPAAGLSRWQPTQTANWVPWQERPLQVLAIGVTFALPAAYLLHEVPAFGFDLPLAISAVFLLFLCTGSKTPVAHQSTFGATIGVLLLGNISWGIAFGIAGALLCEIVASAMQYHGDTVIDPPSVTLLILWLLAVLAAPVAASIAEWAAAALGAAFVLVCGLLLVLVKRNTTALPAADTANVEPVAV